MSRTSRASARRPPRHSARLVSHRASRATVLALVGALVFFTTSAGAIYSSLQGNIDQHNLSDILGAVPELASEETPGDPLAGQAYNILVLGSDSRDGDNQAIGGGDVDGMRADTTLLVHIAADRSRVEVVSIPRDLLVDVPSCPQPDGTMTTPLYAGSSDYGTRFNSAFALGGQTGDVGYAAACAILTVEAMSGVAIQDFVVVDFTGFRGMVDAIGGVPMCIPEALSDVKADLELDAGQQTLNGAQALSFARARYNVGTDGSDLSRIDRQQELLAAMVRQVLSKNLFTDTAALYQFLQAATSSLTTSTGIGSLTTMAGLALSLRSVPAGGVVFTTVPYDGLGNVVVQNAATDQLWELIVADEPITPEPSPTPATSESPSPTATEATSEAPEVEETDAPWSITTGEDEAICP